MAKLDQIEQFNIGNIFPESYEDTYLATRHIAEKPIDIPENVIVKLKEKIVENGVYFGDDNLLREIVAGLVKGNIILQGPPGTGKTTLAKIICEVFHVNFDEATAISDWTTYDTIGGLQPDTDEAGHEILKGKNGCIVESIIHCCNSVVQNEHYDGAKQASWLILDELNRCEIDKVFGELFTAFGNDSLTTAKSIRLWYEKDENKKCIYIPNRYRIIGAMNNIDKNFVFDISQGLSRRFTFIEILPPAEEYFETEVENAKIQAKKRVIGKVGNYGAQKINDSFFETLNNHGAFLSSEREMKDFIRHIRYQRAEDASYLGLALGTAQIIDAYETLYISLILDGSDFAILEKKDVLSMIDMVVASRIVPQIDGFDYMKLNAFYTAISEKSEFNMFDKSKSAILKYIH
ncbi:AAA family ATPase [Petralouisia muris]|uniref:AAA family ATPase n=1 Tax=Petralouisia muris TaxID=3032872 RepID=A0AC61RMQ0_9FIRM|nr:MoxR family ATPase [Petralouisia muris]TGY87704.1 AAA family ATPase [Petralouisia muris]